MAYSDTDLIFQFYLPKYKNVWWLQNDHQLITHDKL